MGPAGFERRGVLGTTLTLFSLFHSFSFVMSLRLLPKAPGKELVALSLRFHRNYTVSGLPFPPTASRDFHWLFLFLVSLDSLISLATFAPSHPP